MSTEVCNDFPRILSALRKEKGVSQRTAATAMGISQALLSHYEKGIREPGLAFVVKACDYYHVSSDYLLGRTYDREGSIVDAEELYDVSQHKDNNLRGSIMAQLNKKLVVNAITVLYGLLGRLGSRELILAVSNIFGCQIYALFRDLRRIDKNNVDSLFTLPDSHYQDGATTLTTLQAMTEAGSLMEELRKEEKELPLTDDVLKKEYPTMWQSLYQVLHRTSGVMTKYLSHHTYDEA
jgi:transcriptional regulator with XRE-family HTH domain